MEKMQIELNGVTGVQVPIPLPAQASVPSEEYLAKRKAAGAKLPIIDVPIPEQDDERGHEEA